MAQKEQYPLAFTPLLVLYHTDPELDQDICLAGETLASMMESSNWYTHLHMEVYPLENLSLEAGHNAIKKYRLNY